MKRSKIIKLSFYLTFITLLFSCSTVKKVNKDEYLLLKNKIYVDGKRKYNSDVKSYIKQHPNKKWLGILPIKQYMNNLISNKYDSIMKKWDNTFPKNEESKKIFITENKLKKNKLNWNYWLYKNSSPPVVLDNSKVEFSVQEIKKFFFNKGYFNVRVNHKITFDKKTAQVEYYINRNKPYKIDSIATKIETLELDSLLKKNIKNQFIKEGQIIDKSNFDNQKDWIYELFRNNGYYTFNKEYIEYEADTNDVNFHATIIQNIKNPIIQTKDTIYSIPHKKFYFKKININYTNRSAEDLSFKKYMSHKGYDIFSKGKMKYTPRSLTDMIMFRVGDSYSEIALKKTFSKFNQTNNFRSKINIDTIGSNTLIANIDVRPLKRFSLQTEINTYISNYYGFGSSANLGIITRNIFGGGENLSILGRVSLGTVETGNKSKNRFFNAIETAIETRLDFPRFVLPFLNTENLFSKYINQSTSIGMLFSLQNNIGLGKVRFNGSFSYKWNVNSIMSHGFDLFNIQYIRNTSKQQYFNLFPSDLQIQKNLISKYKNDNPNFKYSSESNAISKILKDVSFFKNNENNQLLINFQDMLFRKNRITRDYLFTSINYTFTYNERIRREINNPVFFEAKIETSGNLLRLLSNALKFNTNKSGEYELFNVTYAQYLKLDMDTRKNYKLGENSELAFRCLLGLTFPYGNIKVTPYDKSYLAGGTNDIRAWRAYSLGPGSSPRQNSYSVESMKLTLNVEYRFPLFNILEGAIFVDAGNIWSIKQYKNRINYRFQWNTFYKELGIGSGLGLRLDFELFKFRLDGAWKIHDPALPINDRWKVKKLQLLQLKDIYLNVGINYPF